MKKKKSYLFLFLLLIGMCMSYVRPASAATKNYFPGNSNMYWTFSGGELKIYAVRKSNSTFIPDFQNETEVPWYSIRNQIEKVYLDGACENIPNYAFCNCINLKSAGINGGKYLSSIGNYAFFGCEKLEIFGYYYSPDADTIYLPDFPVKTVGYAAFYNCKSVKNIKFSKNISSIADYAFGKCTSVRNITFYDQPPRIANYAFQGVTATVVYPNESVWSSVANKNYGGSLIWKRAGMATSNIKNLKIQYIGLNNRVYNGKPHKPPVVITGLSSSKYTITYKNNINAGTASMTIVPKKDSGYTGSITKKFKIAKANNKITASKTSITKYYSKKAQTVTVKVKALGKAKLSYKSSNKKVTVKSGKIKIPKKFKGKVTITVTAAATKNYKKTTKKITLTVKKKSTSSGSSSGTGGSSGTSGGSGTGSSSSKRRCYSCKGTGNCTHCKGTGIRPVKVNGSYNCVNCFGSGKCYACHGKGWNY